MVYTESTITMALMTTASPINTREFTRRANQLASCLSQCNEALTYKRTQGDNSSSPITLRTILHLSFVGYAMVIMTPTPIARECNLTLTNYVVLVPITVIIGRERKG